MYEIPFRRLKSFWGSTEKHTHVSFHLVNFFAWGRADGVLQNNYVPREPMERETALRHTDRKLAWWSWVYAEEKEEFSLLKHFLVAPSSPSVAFLTTGTKSDEVLRTAMALCVWHHDLDLTENILRSLGGCVWMVILILSLFIKRNCWMIITVAYSWVMKKANSKVQPHWDKCTEIERMVSLTHQQIMSVELSQRRRQRAGERPRIFE